MSQVPTEGRESRSEAELVPDEPSNPMSEDRELKREENANRSASGDPEPTQPWT